MLPLLLHPNDFKPFCVWYSTIGIQQSVHPSIHQPVHVTIKKESACSLFILPFCWAKQLRWMWAIQPTKPWLIVCLQREESESSRRRWITVHANKSSVKKEKSSGWVIVCIPFCGWMPICVYLTLCTSVMAVSQCVCAQCLLAPNHRHAGAALTCNAVPLLHSTPPTTLASLLLHEVRCVTSHQPGCTWGKWGINTYWSGVLPQETLPPAPPAMPRRPGGESRWPCVPNGARQHTGRKKWPRRSCVR